MSTGRGRGLALTIPIGSMYGIFTYIWVIYGVNVGKYSIHGSYGIKFAHRLELRQAGSHLPIGWSNWSNPESEQCQNRGAIPG